MPAKERHQRPVMLQKNLMSPAQRQACNLASLVQAKITRLHQRLPTSRRKHHLNQIGAIGRPLSLLTNKAHHRSKAKCYHSLYSQLHKLGIQILHPNSGIQRHHLHNHRLYINTVVSKYLAKFSILMISHMAMARIWPHLVISHTLIRIIRRHSRHPLKLASLPLSSITCHDLAAAMKTTT